jgi:hypothetical protein
MKPAARALNEEQVKVALSLRHTMKSRQVAAIMGVSMYTIQKLWRGESYKEVAPEIPRFPAPERPERSIMVCERCIHYLNDCCTLGFPEAKRSGSFARQCSVFIPND